MINIAICDDDIFLTSEIEKHLMNFASEMNLDINLDIFFDGQSLLEYINQGNYYHLIFLDIEMNHLNGIDTAYKIRKDNQKVLLIYVTSHENYAKKVFEVSAFRFLTKPVNPSLLKAYFTAACKNILECPNYFQYRYNKISYRLPLDSIIYFQSDLRITYIVTTYGTKKCYARLNTIEKNLKENMVYFFRTHQSFLVNPQYIMEYHYDTIVLQDKTTLSISHNRRKKINELYCNLKGEEIIV